jgi:hypothetical protein
VIEAKEGEEAMTGVAEADLAGEVEGVLTLINIHSRCKTLIKATCSSISHNLDPIK